MLKGGNKSDYFIGMDLGTSAIKGVLMRADGQVVTTVESPVRYRQPLVGRVEADADEYYCDVSGVIRALAKVSPVPVRALSAVAASGNTLLADAMGQALTPVMNWMDQRCVGNRPPALEGLTREDVRTIVGWPCIETFPLAHLAWLRQHKMETFKRAAHVCMNSDWLLFRLTGKWAIDYSTATTFHLQDQRNACWYAPYLKRFDIKEKQLSPLVDSAVVVGKLTPEAASETGLTTQTVVVTGCFDHPGAARSVGVLEPGQLLLSCGTSWVGFLPFADRERILSAGLLCDPFLSPRGGPWGGMFSLTAIAQKIDWYVDNVIAPGEKDRLRIFDETAAQAPSGAGGLVIDLQESPRAVEGDRALISRAVMEGAARALDQQLQKLRQYGFSFNRAVMVGGPSRSPVWPSIVMEITGLDLTVGSSFAGARGAAILSAMGVGAFADETAVELQSV